MAGNFRIEASSDIAAFINRLEKFDKEVSKELKKSMRRGADFVVQAAKDQMPARTLSNWSGSSWVEQDRSDGQRNLQYDQGKAKRSIKVAAFRARRQGATVGFGYIAVQKDPAASIYEVAGPGTRVTGNRGRAFVRNLNRSAGSRPLPRALFPAYYKGMPKAREEIERALQDARRRVGL